MRSVLPSGSTYFQLLSLLSENHLKMRKKLKHSFLNHRNPKPPSLPTKRKSDDNYKTLENDATASDGSAFVTFQSLTSKTET